jgi:hypothetical protein
VSNVVTGLVIGLLSLAAYGFVFWCGFDIGRDISYWEAMKGRSPKDGEAA